MTTVEAQRPLSYFGKKYAKGDTFELKENDGVIWGEGVIRVVKSEPNEEPPAVGRARKPAASPDTMSGLKRLDEAQRAETARKKGIPAGEMP